MQTHLQAGGHPPNMNKALLCCVCITAVVAGISIAQESGAEYSPMAIRPITKADDPTAALQIAFERTGFAGDRNRSKATLSENVSLETIASDNTPFLANIIVGRRVWKVKINDVALSLPSWVPSFAAKQRPRDYEVWIDSATGVLFRIESRSQVVDTDLAPEPPSDTATKMLKGCGEAWLGFPETIPPITFQEALNAAGAANPVEAREIVAWCVMFSLSGKPAIPTWQIIGRGIPPFEFHEHPERPLYKRNRMRSVVDAVTGKEIMFSNMPWVLDRGEK